MLTARGSRFASSRLRSAHVYDVPVRGDTELLLRAADAAYLRRLPDHLQRFLLRLRGGRDDDAPIAVFAADLAGVCLRYALRTLPGDSGQAGFLD